MPNSSHKGMKRNRDCKDGNRPKKKSRSGRSISRQLYDSAIHDIPWDDDLEGAPTGLNREESAIACEMKADIIEMARNADRENAPVSKYPFEFLLMFPWLIHFVRFLLR